jgi:hypothetical protein
VNGDEVIVAKGKSIFVAAAIFTALAIVILASRPITFPYRAKSVILKREREILYQLDHEAVASELRHFALGQRWSKVKNGSKFDFFYGTDAAIPHSLQPVKPSSVRVFDDRIELEFGGAFLHFGIRVFPEGVDGFGTKKLGKGIWFYSQDGRVPAP